MAKVTGPLMSMSATGKLGNAIVFFPWKGISVVREWLKPVNKKTHEQGDIRTIIGGLGRACSIVIKNSQFQRDANELVIGVSTWISQFVKYMTATYMNDKATFEAAYDTWNEQANQALWQSEALALGLAKFSLPYMGTIDEFQHGFQLYALAKYGFDKHATNPTLFTDAIYVKDLATWEQSDFDDFVIDLQTAV